MNNFVWDVFTFRKTSHVSEQFTYKPFSGFMSAERVYYETGQVANQQMKTVNPALHCRLASVIISSTWVCLRAEQHDVKL